MSVSRINKNRVILLFIDGVGIGEKDSSNNPFFKFGFKTFEHFFGSIPHRKNDTIIQNEFFLFPTDARLGVEGLPQSGTGQTSIFCGINASKIVGKHFGPFPYSTLVPIIEEKNIFRVFQEKNSFAFVNAYPKIFFDYLQSGKNRLSVTTLSCKLNNFKLNRVTEVRRGEALTAEITNEVWKTRLGYSLPIIKPKTAARRLLRISENNQLTVYEFFLTDHLGHGRNADSLEKILKILDEFLFTILFEFDRKSTTVILCSDHGNFEDLSIKTHTLNPALTISAGKHAKYVFETVKDLTQIKQTIIEITE